MNYSESCQQMGYAILQEASKPLEEAMKESISFIAEHATEANWDAVHRSMEILRQGFENRKPYTDKLMQLMKEYAKKEFQKDMIYYSLCYDGFRV